jgi:sulfur carrier protein
LLVYVNGETKDLPPNLTLQALIESLTLKSERVAAELNGLIVPRAQWPSTSINDGDRIEIVHFVGGG